MEKADVAIIGGGPAGAAAAIALVKHTKLRVALAEGGTFDSAIKLDEMASPSLLPLLEYLDVAERFRYARHQKAKTISIAWGADTLTELNSMFTGNKNGWSLNRNRFDRDLCKEAAVKGAEVFLNTMLTDFKRTPNGWELWFKGGEKTIALRSRFLLDATGRMDIVGEKLGIESVYLDDLVAIIGMFDAPEGLTARTLIEATEDGWWYVTQMSDNKLAAVFMTDADIASENGYDNIEYWADKICRTKHIFPLINNAHLAGPLVIHPARSRYQMQYSGENWLSTGDSAMNFDPISSMGISHALSSGIHAARAVASALRGDADALRNYSNELSRNLKEFQARHREIYRLETRWSNSPFWKRRHAAAKMRIEESDPKLS